MKLSDKAKFITAIFAMSLIMSSCGDTSNQSENTNSSDQSDTETTAPVVVDPLEKLGTHDFGGAEYIILSSDNGYGNQPSLDFEITVAEANGEVLNDAVYNRQVKIEDRYNVKIVSEKLNRSQVTETVKRSVTAGDMEYSLVNDAIYAIRSAVTGDYFANFYDFEDIDLNAPWWNQTATESLTINGSCYIQLNYINAASALATHCLFYNKRLAEDYNMPDIYGMVLDGKWTMDKLLELSESATVDLNGDSKYDDNDQYGFMGSFGAIGIMHYGCDNPFISISDDGKVSHMLFTERMQTTIEKIYTLCYEGNYAYARPISDEPKLPPMFANGQALFYAGFLFDMVSTFRDMEDDFGLLPYPKFDEVQDGYYTAIHGAAPMIVIPRAVEDPKMVGVITEALAIESYNTVRPALVEYTVRNKLLRDEQSSQIYDIFLDGIRVDVALVYNGGNTSVFECIHNLMSSKSTDLASYVAQRMPSAMNSYQKVIDHFMGKD